MKAIEKRNEILKISSISGVTYTDLINMIYVVYKDIEKIKKHLGIED